MLEGAIFIIEGVAGVQPQLETNWRLADRYNVPRIIFINKLDCAWLVLPNVAQGKEARGGGGRRGERRRIGAAQLLREPYGRVR